ncbi:S4 domain-containing protein YaaA [Anaerobacillus isosaccharinicus]|uniref:S4 domain-containing protein YaaA n=1 Tax=Anaerobacillus isosaccharinicus TaxID=1532552 RepID=A0A1S2MFF1_9BACI|nr:S4 domain-containing protein YaaA [Anaerobacillus isosaccharinicus]MBA5584206.1 S4 domain-containing protein YaaA [Anaerobacillus isosaccharinicus]QOY37391.1 S4 domain-containing protein YaaA [Anaerobacillus isosaccharinicus]
METNVNVSTEFITLGQFLKEVGIIDTGGMAKWFLSEHEVYLNNELENRRGKKLYNDDVISIPSHGTYRIISTI